jgi:hypothetical protein
MNRDQIIHKKLHEIASAATSGHTNPWLRIRSRIDQTAVSEPKHTKKYSWKFVIALVSLLAVSSLAYACYRVMTDPALQAVENEGLVSHLNLTANPTLFAPVPTQYITTSGISQTKKGITVTLDWAYVDEARLAYQLTITGLTIPKGMNSQDIICPPNLTDDEGIVFPHGLIGGGEILGERPGKPIEVGEDLVQLIDASKFDHLDLHLDLTIGPCSPYWNYSETNITKPPPVPLIGNFHLDFRIPIFKGITITADQSVEAHGVTMRLEAIKFNHSHIDMQVCFKPPHIPTLNYGNWVGQYWAITDKSWAIWNATMRIVGHEPVGGGPSSIIAGSQSKTNEECDPLGFDVPSDGQPAIMVVTIPELQANDDEALALSPEWQKIARQQLSSQGIDLDFHLGSDSYWEITRKPVGMTDSEAEQKIQDLFVHKYEGPWIFTIIKQP